VSQHSWAAAVIFITAFLLLGTVVLKLQLKRRAASPIELQLSSRTERELAAASGRAPQGAAEALRAAAKRGDVVALRRALVTGVEREACDAEGNTALLSAAQNNQLECIHTLLAFGASCDARNAEGLTALLCCAKSGFLEGARQLLSSGAALEARDSAGRTALMLAAMEDRVDIVRLLVEQGADTAAADEEGRAAAALARSEAARAAVLAARHNPRLTRGSFLASAGDLLDLEERAADGSECVICLCAPRTRGLLHGATLHAVACDGCAPLLLHRPCPIWCVVAALAGYTACASDSRPAHSASSRENVERIVELEKPRG